MKAEGGLNSQKIDVVFYERPIATLTRIFWGKGNLLEKSRVISLHGKTR